MKNICIDIGGKSSKIAIFEKNKIIYKNNLEYENDFIHIDALEKLLNEEINFLVKKFEIENICISSPGVVNEKTGEVSGLSAIVDLNKKNLKEIFEKKFNKKVYIENDANCAIIAELEEGNLKNVDNALALVIGSGLGGAIVIDGKIYKGSFLNAGEFGCGLFNLNEEVYENNSEHCSMHSLEQMYLRRTSNIKSAKEIFDSYENDETSKISINQLIFNLSKVLTNLAFTLDPRIIIIGGAVSKNDLFMDLLKKEVDLLYSKVKLPINFKFETCKYFNDSNLIGANLLSKK